MGGGGLSGVWSGGFEVVGWCNLVSCKRGEVWLLVLTFYLPNPIPFICSFSAHQPPQSSHLQPIILADVLGTGCVLVVE